MKITCACGISQHIGDYPVGDIEENGKKMKERHMNCRCKREWIIRTSPKDEADYEGDDAGKMVSFDELSKRLGVGQNGPIEPEDETKVQKPLGKVTLFLSDREPEVFTSLVNHYGEKYKQGDKEAQDEYAKLAAKGIEGIMAIEDDAEIRRVRCALSERNITDLYPVGEFDYEDEHNVQMVKIANTLSERLEKELA